MKKGRFLLLAGLWTLTLTLFVVAAAGAARETTPATMTGEETGYRHVTETVPEGEKKATVIRVEECLSEQELSRQLSEYLTDYAKDITVTAGKDTLTVRGVLTADDEKLLAVCPELEPYRLVLRLAQGREAQVTASIRWNKTTGFTVVPVAASLAGVDLDPRDMAPLMTPLQNTLKEPDKVTITRWELLPGGLYRHTEEQIEE